MLKKGDLINVGKKLPKCTSSDPNGSDYCGPNLSASLNQNSENLGTSMTRKFSTGLCSTTAVNESRGSNDQFPSEKRKNSVGGTCPVVRSNNDVMRPSTSSYVLAAKGLLSKVNQSVHFTQLT